MARLKLKKNVTDRILGRLFNKGDEVEGTLEKGVILGKDFRPADGYLVTNAKGISTYLNQDEVIILEA